MKKTIKQRNYEAKFTGAFSTLNYNIVASGTIVNEILKKIYLIEDKYPKEWGFHKES